MARRPRAAQTAFGPMVITAVEQYEQASERIVTDPLALRFLPPGLALMARLCRLRPVRNWLVKATDAKALGIWGGVLCRKRYAADQVAAALADGIDQVVVLGAGLDTLGCRLTGAVPVFEVDLPANIATKQARVRAALGALPGHVHLVPVDFETDDLTKSLSADGFDPAKPIMVVWEAVTQYLTDAAVRDTFAWLATAAPGSRLVFTYVRRDFLDGTDLHDAEGAHRDFVTRHRVWHYGLHPEQVAPLLTEHGWTEDEQVGTAEYRQRYLEPAGRDLPVSAIERFVAAVKR